MSPLDLNTEKSSDGTVRLVLTGEFDIASAPQVEEEMTRLEAGEATLILLDLRGLEFMDSTGLRTVVGADTRAREQGRRLLIVPGPEAVHRIFEVTGLTDRLEFVDDPAAAGA
jgi:anti-sigma B factor antagonist